MNARLNRNKSCRMNQNELQCISGRFFKCGLVASEGAYSNLSHPFSKSNFFVYFYLGSDLVAALAGLQVHNLAHDAAGRTMAGMQEPRFCLLLHALGLSCCFCSSLYNARLLTPLLGWTRGARWRHPHGNQGWRREGGPWARGDTG